MKKKLLLIIMSVVIACCMCFAACNTPAKDNGQPDYVKQSYEIALEKGYDGTLEEWIELLRGEKGEDGKDAYRLAVESASFDGTLEEWLQSLKGKDGKDGADGKDGTDGKDGAAGRGIADVKIEDGRLYVKYTDGDAYQYVGIVKGEDGKDGKDGDNGFNGIKGEDGKDGKDGVSINSMFITEDGVLYAHFTNGNKIAVGKVVGEKGEKGDKGEQGRGVAEFKIIDGVLTVRYTDSDKFYLVGNIRGEKGEKGDKGEDGKDGTNGKDGKDGVGIADVKIENGVLFIKMSDSDKYVLVGRVQGEKGDKGEDGKDGADGKNLDIDDIYASAVNAGYTGSFLDFLKEYLNVEATQGSEQIISKTMLSTVAIGSKFVAYKGSEKKVSVGGGSGVIFKGDKTTGEVYILTNFHVVHSVNTLIGQTTVDNQYSISQEIYVFFYGTKYTSLSTDNAIFSEKDNAGNYIYNRDDYRLLEKTGIKAEYVCGSATADIAVLRIENCEKYKNGPYVPAEIIADSDAIVEGATAYVVGNADGEGLSATAGIVSMLNQNVTISSSYKYDGVTVTKDITRRQLRVDAAINPGNSGGGLYDAKGRLMGIVNAKTTGATIDNFGYALPINSVLGVIDNMMRRAASAETINDNVTKYNHGYNKCLLGISVAEENGYAYVDKATGIVSARSDVVIRSVDKKSENGGVADGILEVGDVILSVEVNGIKHDVYLNHQIGDVLSYAHKGDTAYVTVRRGDNVLRLAVPLTAATYYV